MALFFLFNTGQLSSEKTKLVNTADAVAYSAGVMHARALNFDAYTNRALMANEIMIAQMVSISSWVQYAQGHVEKVGPLNCLDVEFAVPVWLGLKEYFPLCFILSLPVTEVIIDVVKEAVDVVAPIVVTASEAAKFNLQAAQNAMFASFLSARKELMQQVADANYLNDGVVEVDPAPLTDNYKLFDGDFFIAQRSGDERTRFREAELSAAQKDGFVKNRSWTSSPSPFPPCIAGPRGIAERSGATGLIGFDEWKAGDKASLSVESWHVHLFSAGCETDVTYPLGDGSQSANTDASSSSDWSYSGVPSFYELSTKALAYGPGNPDIEKQDPRLKFSVRLTRAKTQAKTSAGRSAIKPAGQMAIYQGREAKDVMAAVATSEVFFERSAARADGYKELASLFNPYWQVHLMTNSAADVATAVARQTGAAP